MKEKNENGVSPVIGEMLMLSLVLILVSLFAVSASNYIPEDREPSLNIMMEKYAPSGNDYNVTLWHKGGDTVPIRDIKIIFSNEDERFPLYSENLTINDDPDSNNFMPGDFMEIDTAGKDVDGYTIQMVISKSVVFTGRIDS